VQWVRSLGGPGKDYSDQVAVDSFGNCYVAGSFEQTARFWSGNLTSAGDRDAFIAKFDPDGNLLWARRGGGVGKDGAEGLSVNAAGDVVVAGIISGTAQIGTNHLVSAGDWDIFVAKYSAAGALQWARRAGGSGRDGAVGSALDDNG